MRVLVDTCVWSLALARRMPRDSPEVAELRRLILDGDGVLLAAIVLQGLLQAARSSEQHDALMRTLAPFELLLPTRDDHELAAQLFRICRSKGVAVGTVDALIAALAIRSRAMLLTVDEDFVRIAGLTKLRLLRPRGE